MKLRKYLLAIVFLFHIGLLHSQQTVGLFQYQPGAVDGYTLVAPVLSNETYLIDNCGRQVHQWPSAYATGLVARLLENGQLLRTCYTSNSTFNMAGRGGRVELINWDGSLAWYYDYSTSSHVQHHDAIMLPNGHVMLVAWEAKSSAEAVAAGRNPLTSFAGVWPDALIEIEPTAPGNGNIVWEWHAWDHLIQDFDANKANFGVVADHPELIDLNYWRQPSFRDWNHVNSVDYNPALDQLIISVHNFDEVWIIDHSTTTQEAASHTGGLYGRGGDLLYRWGNPEAYDRGSSADHILWGQHDAHWIPEGDQFAGQIIVFNNGFARSGPAYSSVDIWQPPMDSTGNYILLTGQPYGPSTLSYSYQSNPQTDLYSAIISGAHRLPGNHTLICEGTPGRILEVDSLGQTVWEYVCPVNGTGPIAQGSSTNATNSLFRAYRYLPTFPGLIGRPLTPGTPIELNPLPFPSICNTSAVFESNISDLSIVPFPNPNASGRLQLQSSISLHGRVLVQLWDALGNLHYEENTVANGQALSLDLDTQTLPTGMYWVRLEAAGKVAVRPVALTK